MLERIGSTRSMSPNAVSRDANAHSCPMTNRTRDCRPRWPARNLVLTSSVAVEGELYEMSDEIWRRVEAGEPPGLYRGPVRLSDGRVVDGILFPRALAEGKHPDISAHGGWRAYLASTAAR
jgi:hypothetical protein